MCNVDIIIEELEWQSQKCTKDVPLISLESTIKLDSPPVRIGMKAELVIFRRREENVRACQC